MYTGIAECNIAPKILPRPRQDFWEKQLSYFCSFSRIFDQINFHRNLEGRIFGEIKNPGQDFWPGFLQDFCKNPGQDFWRPGFLNPGQDFFSTKKNRKLEIFLLEFTYVMKMCTVFANNYLLINVLHRPHLGSASAFHTGKWMNFGVF